jgi:hypothetical protein
MFWNMRKNVKKTALMSTQTSPKSDQPKHAKTWLKLHSTWTMFTLICVVKHALGCLELVPCGGHVGAASTTFSTGSATCKQCPCGPLVMWQRMWSRQNLSWPQWNLTWPWWHPIWLVFSIWRGVPCQHTIRQFGIFKNVFILISPTTHVCFRSHPPWFSGVC